MDPAVMTEKAVPELAGELDEARTELEADMQAAANDALWEGVLVIDLSWLLCCSIPGSCRKCAKGNFRPGKARVAPRTSAGPRRTDRRR